MSDRMKFTNCLEILARPAHVWQCYENDYLKNLNKHPRDMRIQFFEEGHIYDIDGDRTFTSATTLIGRFHEHFDPEKILANIRKKGKFDNPCEPKYYQKNEEILKQEWAEAGRVGSGLGTIMHYNIECHANKNPFTCPDMKEIGYHYQKFIEDHQEPRGLIPYRTEWFVFDESIKIAGSIDMVYQISPDDDVNLMIYDWKRTKEMSYENKFTKAKMLYPFENYPDTNYYHYCVQLNLYKYILESLYGKIVHKLCLVVLHEKNDSYELHECIDLQKEIKEVVRLRKEEIENDMNRQNNK